jgi:DNA-binding MarR family transcriptional regulator
MAPMSGDLGFDLHRLTAQLDRAADRLLDEAFGLSYRRFVTLLLVGELRDPTQRALAEALGISEPSASRMVTVLAEVGLLEVSRAPEGGNRRRLALTPSGKEVVERSRELLEQRIARLLDRSGVPYAAYGRHTRALLDALIEQEAEGRPGT